jgi:hypothetical protein
MKRIGFVEHSDELFKKYFKDAIYLNTIVWIEKVGIGKPVKIVIIVKMF